MNLPQCRWLIALAVMLAGATGCQNGLDLSGRDAKIEKLHKELEETTESLREARQINHGMQIVVIDQQKQIRTLRRLGDERLKKIFHVQAIRLGQYTGGADFDGQAGDDGIKVYLRPIDQRGDTIKAAGEVKIRLYDLAAPAGKNLIGEYNWPVEKMAGAFSGGFMTYHFSFECPWKSGPPQHREITVRVEFVDYLTGRHFSAQKLCKVDVASEPATKPAAGNRTKP